MSFQKKKGKLNTQSISGPLNTSGVLYKHDLVLVVSVPMRGRNLLRLKVINTFLF